MKLSKSTLLYLACATVVGGTASFLGAQEEIPHTDTFFLEDCALGPLGVNKYFIPLKPGSFLLFKGENGEESETLRITVLNRTKRVAGVLCAVVREMEWVDEEIAEISWNYFAICRKCNDVFYFGEDVDIYEDGEVASHGGAWLAGENGAKPGLIMPGRPLNGARYYQEIAPDVALDRAEHLDDKATVETPAATFHDCLFVAETTPLESGHTSYKFYARGVGLIQDGDLKLAAYGWSRQEGDSEPKESQSKAR